MIPNPVVIVTGASRGLGAAVAHWLAKSGAGVTLVARSADELAVVAQDLAQLEREPLVRALDVADYGGCRRAVRATMDHFGRIDALVNNAGIIQPVATIANSDPESWRRNLEVNLLGPYNLTRAALRHLRAFGGRVVNVSSGAATRALEHLSAYCTAKAALNHFTRVLAAEEPVLTALTIRPGVVDTDMQTCLRGEGGTATPAELAAYYRQLKEHQQLEPPEIPARSIAWLALFAPREFSGQFLDYDDPRIRDAAATAFGSTASR
jgi:NAD(P)-dependent dehydrogenase (short-subunit alcohol dehydrogenase family)